MPFYEEINYFRTKRQKCIKLQFYVNSFQLMMIKRNEIQLPFYPFYLSNLLLLKRITIESKQNSNPLTLKHIIISFEIC